MAVVTFNADVFPYCKGDTVNLTADEQKRVDEAVKTRSLKDAYTVAKSEAKKATPKAKK